MKKTMFCLATALSVLLISCNEYDDGNDQKQSESIKLNKNNSVDLKITEIQKDSFVLVKYDRTTYDLSGKVIAAKTSFDTLPSLRVISDTLDTGRTYEDDNGDTQPIDTIIRHRDNYQIFIAVKKDK